MIPPRLEPVLEAGTPPMELAAAFAAGGHELYLVGGSVRDVLLNRPVEDFDFATGARPDEIKRILAPWADHLYLVGETFGTVGAMRGGRVYEITTFRSDVYRDESRKPHVAYSDNVETDLSRRDFTVNAIALRLPERAGDPPQIIDPYGGLVDLAQRMLRTPLDPQISFADDPLRMLRLYRFQSTLGFDPDPAAVAAVGEMRERLRIVSAERIRDELSKLMVGPGVAAALRGVADSRLADEFIPEIPALALEQDPVHHHKDVLAHTIAVVAKCPARLEVRLAGLFHDIGKPKTREIGPVGVSFHHHEVVGARLTRERMRALRYPKEVIERVARLVYLHMRPHTYKMGWTDRAVRRYVRDAGEQLCDLNDLVRSDVTTRNARRARAIERRIDELEERIADLRKLEELDAIRPPIDGHQVMDHLGIAPGPAVGEAMAMLLDHRLDSGPYTPDEAYRLLDQWAAHRGVGPGGG